MVVNKAAKILTLGSLLLLGNEATLAEEKGLLETLLHNGTLTQTQYHNLQQQNSKMTSDVEDSLLEVLLRKGTINQAEYASLTEQTVIQKSDNKVIVKLDAKGFQVETADQAFKFKLGGRIQVDATFNANDKDFDQRATEGVEVRRARLYASGIVWHDFDYKAQFDFADNAVGIKDLFVKYTGLDWFNMTVGNQKHAISMELQESSNDIMFTERSLVNSLTGSAFDRAIGLRLDSSGKDWSAQLGFYGDRIAANKVQLNDEGWGVASRVSFAPINTKSQLLHLGAYAGYRATSDKNTTLAFKYETTHMSNLYFTNATVEHIDSTTIAGFEAAYMFGPFSVQSEYAHAWIDRDGLGGVDFGAYYVQAGWTLTGESRSYKGAQGKFKRLQPANEFSWQKGSWGAWELATRIDGNDLNSGDIQGGKETALTLALNWYLNRNLRLMADYRYAFDIQDSAVKDIGGGDIDSGTHDFTLRTQLTF